MDADSFAELLEFHQFLTARTGLRLQRYREAVAVIVKPGATVLDLGTGTGILALFACQAGARHVYALDESPVLEFARTLARANGFDECVTFLSGRSDRVILPGRADVLVTDTYGIFGLQSGGLRSVRDARARLLTREADLIPARIDLFVAPVEAAGQYDDHVDGWNTRPGGIDLAPLREVAVNSRYAVRFDAGALIAEPQRLASIDLRAFDDVVMKGRVRHTISRAGVVHGVAGWFSAQLADDLTLDNNPREPSTNYRQAFFPLERPVRVRPGDSVSTAITSHDNLQLHWCVEFTGGDSSLRARFNHSTFFGAPLSLASLRELKAGNGEQAG